MNQILKMVLVLTILGLISGLVLSLVSNYATPLIHKNEQEAMEEAIYYVLPETANYETKTANGKTLYVAKDEGGTPIGLAFTASGSGYQGTIKLMVGVTKDLEKVKGIEILESEETPGLGGKIRGENFKSQFRDLVARQDLTLVKAAPTEPGEVQAITGATISSKTVINTINKEINTIKELDVVKDFLSPGA